MKNNLSSIVVKSLLNAVASWLLVALVFTMKTPGLGFTHQLMSVHTIFISITAFAGSFIGYLIRENRGANRL